MMPVALLCAGAAIALNPTAALGQNVVTWSENPDGTVRATPDFSIISPSGIEIFTTFGASKGAYRNGLVFLGPTTSEMCTLEPPGSPFPIPDEPSCKYFTGECENACGIGTDPNAAPGEISCYCLKADPAWSKSEPYAFIPFNGGSPMPIDFNFKLITDWNGDGVINDEQHARPALNSGRDQMRLSQASATVGQMDWEDIPQGPQGDFNDMTFFLQARSCNAEVSGAPTHALDPDSPSNCVAGCPTDPQNCPALSAFDAQFSVTLSVQARDPEWAVGTRGIVDRESRGRLLFVIVQTFAEPSTAGPRMAVCPELILNNEGTVLTRAIGYGRSPIVADSSFPVPGFGNGCISRGPNLNCCELQSAADGKLICGYQDNEFSGGPNQPVVANNSLWLARDQEFGFKECDQSSRSGPGDGFDVLAERPASAGSCAYRQPHTEIYEIPLSEIDAQLGTALESQPDDDVLSFVQDVKLTIVHSLAVEPFYCPAGFNYFFSNVESSIGVVESRFINGTNLQRVVRQ
ncbi:MAG: hypothetical protein HC923_03895 [Myxococcales bacterium]|nr:hypothetical protein [Myxococcales bacterium]